jgi:hypothetical protein
VTAGGHHMGSHTSFGHTGATTALGGGLAGSTSASHAATVSGSGRSSGFARYSSRAW